MGRGDAYIEGTRRKAAGRPAMHGTYPDVGGKADGPERYAGGVEPIDIIERVVDGLPPDKAYSLGQVLRYCLRAGRRDDIDVELGKANNYAHRLVFGHWRSRWRHTT
nr:MAG: protein of unknown function DUF3310 [Bacteriophage sp.]